MQVKYEVDKKLEGQEDLLKNEAFFTKYLMQLVVQEFKKKENIDLNFESTQSINHLIAKEYLQLYRAI
jgi:type I restriction enzyme R subunit